MNTDNRFPLEDCFKGVDNYERPATEQFLDLIESELAHKTLDSDTWIHPATCDCIWCATADQISESESDIEMERRLR